MMRRLARGIAMICYTVNPATVVIGGGISAEGAYLRPLLHEALFETLLPEIFTDTKFRFARLGNDAALLGALYHLRSLSTRGLAGGEKAEPP